MIKRDYILMLLMIAASLMGMSLRPTHKLVDVTGHVKLETLIPQHFNDWHVEDMAAPLVNPEAQAAINLIYAQTLSRTYIDSKGNRIMLSIAYGEDQTDSVGAHLPEGCYAGQGFGVNSIVLGNLPIENRSIPVTRLLAVKSERIEPITYWLRTGNQVAYGGFDTKKIKLNYAIQGIIPDALLFRVSAIVGTNSDVESAYQLQAKFVSDLISNIDGNQRLALIGIDKKN